MKTTITAALTACLVLAASSAQAEVRKVDPSGAPMCFTEDGDKAPLSQCDGVYTQGLRYQLRADPSGAPMCFGDNGQLQPLRHCKQFKALTQPSVLSDDPSGAPQCFDANGDKLALARCSFSLDIRTAVLNRVLAPAVATRSLIATLD